MEDQQKATYRAATQDILAVLSSCTQRKDALTIDDMDVVHKQFGAFMRSHPTLSEGYIRLTGGMTDPSADQPPSAELEVVADALLSLCTRSSAPHHHLPDRRPTKPYQGVPRGRPVGSGRRSNTHK